MAIDWLTTSPNPSPRAYKGGPDCGQRGWRLHAVVDPQWNIEPSVWDLKGPKRSRTKALCGLSPRHGWGIDMFIEDRCERCEAILDRINAQQPTQRAEGE